jgi:hypothetical protein
MGRDRTIEESRFAFKGWLTEIAPQVCLRDEALGLRGHAYDARQKPFPA